MYSIDTNVFIDWWQRWYPTDVFPSVQKAIEGLVTLEKLFAPARVHEEINRVASRDLRDWAKTNKMIFVPHDPEIQTEAMEILHSYEGLIDTTTVEDEADRWVIALAKVKGLTVVTHETSVRLKRKPDRSLYIPDVCMAMKIPCIGLIDLMRREKWAF